MATEPIPSIACDRCKRMTPWSEGGFRMWMRPHKDVTYRRQGSAGFYLCPKCGDDFAVDFMRQYERHEATGKGPAIVGGILREPGLVPNGEGTGIRTHRGTRNGNLIDDGA